MYQIERKCTQKDHQLIQDLLEANRLIEKLDKQIKKALPNPDYEYPNNDSFKCLKCGRNIPNIAYMTCNDMKCPTFNNFYC